MATRPAPSRRRAPKTRKRASKARSQGTAGREFQNLVDIMVRLRSPHGCPWDREQTIQSLRGFVLEETYEVLDAIDRSDHDALKGEIGDLLFEGVFLAQVEADERRFTVADSLRAISEKLIRRHPHIFGSTASPVRTAGQVVEQWEQIKAREQKDAGERRSLLRGVPASLPSLLRAREIGTRVAAVGFDWAHTADVVDKIEEEVAELRRALASEGHQRAEEEMGDLLFSIANLARKLGIEPESALRQANAKFSTRFETLERAFEVQGRSVHDATPEEMEAEWVKAKQATHNDPLNGPTANAKKRRSEETKKKTKSTQKSTPASRAGRTPAKGRRQK
ncbi:MAG: nucleoside triphosphate pyrophosphohydrolase [Acidobacteria bacterium]|nr:nucleoside triphosphate pyrophosphohydrolase [Acidobacteriota bacterium]